MIIKIILTFVLLFFFVYAFTQRTASRLISRFLFLIVFSGIYFVWFPEQTGVIANFVGVGRGVDLIFYCLFVLGLIAVFGVYLRIKDLYSITTSLARHIALSEPLVPDKAGSGPDSEKLENQ